MIALACDHGAFDLKQAIMKHLEARGLAYKDFGCYDKTSCDYPDFAAPAARGRRIRRMRQRHRRLHDRHRRFHHRQQGQGHPLRALVRRDVRSDSPASTTIPI